MRTQIALKNMDTCTGTSTHVQSQILNVTALMLLLTHLSMMQKAICLCSI